MALVTYPLNKIEYSAEDAELFHATRTSGIYANNSFGYDITGADNNIVIGTGIGWIKNSEFSGKVIAQKEAISLDIGLPDPVYPRIDAIVIQFDNNRNETNIVVKKGTAASNPVAPSVVQNESVYELHLYHVRREAGSLYITPSNITDLRLNSSYCGLMADSVTHIDTTAIERQVADLIESLQNEISHVIDGSAYLFRDGSTNMTGNLPMDGHKVTGLGTPTADDDAVTLGYANRNYRASSWTPTAEEVGARPSNWVPTAEQVGAAPASSVGTNKVFNKLTDIGITTFPTTMKTVANSMPANSTLMLDSRDIVSDSVNEISDLGATWAGMYMFMRGNSNARLSLLHIYGATGATTSNLNYGCYAATNDSVVWLRASNTAKVKLWENAKITSTFNAQTISLDLSGYDGVEILYYVDSTTNIYQNTGFIKTGLPGIMYYVTASTGNRLHRIFTVNTTGIKFETAEASSGAAVGGLCIPYQIYGIKGVG